MQRIEKFRPGTLTPDQSAVYDAVAGGARARGVQHFPLRDEDGCLVGPFNAFLLSPRIGLTLQELGAAIRFESSLTPRERELAILLVAHDCASEFEWYAHERVGRAAGVTQAELDTIRSNGRVELQEPRESAVCNAVTAILDVGDVDDALYEVLTPILGAELIFELVTLIGYYQMLALQLRVFRVDS